MLEKAIKTIRTLLPSMGSVTLEEIEDAVDTVLAIKTYSGIDRDVLTREVQANYNIRLEEFRIIESGERRRPWINEKRSSINWNFWNRYKDYLQIEKNFANTVINQLDRLTDRTLDGLFDPGINASISKYGLVVGQVQSGKTANYTGLICKAADAGYNLIIVLAGVHNNLRTQTQIRIDEGFLGFDTQFQRAFDTGQHTIGVGIGRNPLPVHSATSSADGGDFSNRTTLTFHTNEPIIIVIKKTKPRLEKLAQWLLAQSVQDASGKKKISSKNLLLIDDEADHASINTSKEEDAATTTNRLIRDVISLFNKVGYVGYTATPFANIFMPINEDDLFPKDFIINIPAPSNYIGPDRIFGFRYVEEDEVSDTVLPIVNRIDDYTLYVPDKHKKADLPDWNRREDVPEETVERYKTNTPESLKNAIKSFILTCAIRRLRGQVSVHNSMLIHVSRYKNWQKLICRVVEEIFSFYKMGIDMSIPSVVEEFRELFEIDKEGFKSYKTISQQIIDSPLSEIDPSTQVHTWNEVLSHLFEAAARIQVKEINGGSADALNYFDHKNGLSVIAIGGDKLSRGLTLEGLSVSYYLRASRMYDTLMQMGRWFGYRPGYVDLCRLFTSRELNEWFCHIALASEELRNEFDYMSDIAGSTPEQYALRVRTHPGVLQISASNKIRRAVTVDISWAGRLVESYEFQKNEAVNHSNLEATIEFIKSLNDNPIPKKDNYLWMDVQANYIKSFLQKFRLSESLKAADPANLLRFVDVQLANNELTEWRVGVMSKKNTDQRIQVKRSGFTLDIGCYMRNYDDKNSNEEIYYLKKSHIISPRDEFIDLTEPEIIRAMDKTTDLWNKKGKEGIPSYPNGEVVRNEIRKPQNPLLLIYFLDPAGANRANDKVQLAEPIIGFAISFPGSRFFASVSYAVHKQLLPNFIQEDNLDEEDDIDED